MGRPRKHSTAAAKQRAYRLRRRAVALEPEERYETLASGWGLLDLDLVPLQRRFLADVMRPEVSIGALCTPRSVGKTTLLGRLAGLSLVPGSPIFTQGRETVLVAGSMRQAESPVPGEQGGARGISIVSRCGTTTRKKVSSRRPTRLVWKLSIYPSSGNAPWDLALVRDFLSRMSRRAGRPVAGPCCGRLLKRPSVNSQTKS